MDGNQAVVRYTGGNLDTFKLGEILARSGFFQDTRDAAQAIVKILAGQELGIGPIAAMTGVYIVKGRVSLSANLMATAIRRSRLYDYRVKSLDDKAASIEFFALADGKREALGVSTFTLEDARRAGTQNMDKFPRNMLFARAMSNGAKWYCPDVFAGPVYTPDELGAAVNEDGEVIDAQPVVAAQPEPAEPTELDTLKQNFDLLGTDIYGPQWPELRDKAIRAQARHGNKGEGALNADDYRVLIARLEGVKSTEQAEQKAA